jgi:hypothetical protein
LATTSAMNSLTYIKRPFNLDPPSRGAPRTEDRRSAMQLRQMKLRLFNVQQY